MQFIIVRQSLQLNEIGKILFSKNLMIEEDYSTTDYWLFQKIIHLWQWDGEDWLRMKRSNICATNVVIDPFTTVQCMSIWEGTTETRKKNHTSAAYANLPPKEENILWHTWKLSTTKMWEFSDLKTSGKEYCKDASSVIIPLSWDKLSWCIWENILVKNLFSVTNALVQVDKRPF